MCVFPVVLPCSENVKALSEAKRRVLAAVKGRMNPLKESLTVVRVRVLARYYRALTCTCCGRRTVCWLLFEGVRCHFTMRGLFPVVWSGRHYAGAGEHGARSRQLSA